MGEPSGNVPRRPSPKAEPPATSGSVGEPTVQPLPSIVSPSANAFGSRLQGPLPQRLKPTAQRNPKGPVPLRTAGKVQGQLPGTANASTQTCNILPSICVSCLPEHSPLSNPTIGDQPLANCLLYVPLLIQGTNVRALLDSGASDNFISTRVAAHLCLHSTL